MSVHLVLRKLRDDYGLRIPNHTWLRYTLKRFSGWDASTCAFMVATAWQRRH